MDLFEHATAQRLADEGMRRAADHADRATPEPKWTDQAFAFFRRYALANEFFHTEDVRVWAYQNGLPHDPAKGKSWGTVAVRAQRDEIVVIDHYAKTKIPPAHATPRAVYRSLIYKGVTVYA